MKKLNLLIVMILITTATKAQLYIESGLGVDYSSFVSKDAKDNEGLLKIVIPILKVEVGYQFNSFTVGTLFEPTLTTRKNHPIFLGGKVGYTFGSITPTIGYYFNNASSDNTEYNFWSAGIGLRYMKDIENKGLYIEGLYLKDNFQATIGYRYYFE